MKHGTLLVRAGSVLLLAAATSAGAASAPEKAVPELGQLDFPVTGSPECQRLFRQGMLEMHSFQYDQAHASFGAALQADSGCAMAAWGDAMAYQHPVWGERDVVRGKAALAGIAREDTLTPRERAHIAVARALYDAPDAKAGYRAWLSAVARMRAEYPDDDEVALQHALALIAVHGYDKTRQREQSEAGAIALDVLSRRPDHPGAAHYIIHAFDNPEHAVIALPAARTYARIAPAAAHALHMPSHTFTHLGMWRDVVPSNVRAYASSQAAAKALRQSPEKWDWHSYAWLVAAHLELGQPGRAKTLVEDARALLATNDSPELRLGYSDIAKNYLTQTGRWAEAEALAMPLLAPIRGESADGSGPVACAEHAPGGGGEERAPLVHFARIAAHTMRAEAALRTGEAARRRSPRGRHRGRGRTDEAVDEDGPDEPPGYDLDRLRERDQGAGGPAARAHAGEREAGHRRRRAERAALGAHPDLRARVPAHRAGAYGRSASRRRKAFPGARRIRTRGRRASESRVVAPGRGTRGPRVWRFLEGARALPGACGPVDGSGCGLARARGSASGSGWRAAGRGFVHELRRRDRQQRWCRRWESNPHAAFAAQDFKPRVYASSTTPARRSGSG